MWLLPSFSKCYIIRKAWFAFGPVCVTIVTALYTSLNLVRLEEMCIGTEWLLIREHKHRCATWTSSLIMHIKPPWIIKKSRNMIKMRLNKPQKIGKVTFSVLFSIVLPPHYDVIIYVQELTMLDPNSALARYRATGPNLSAPLAFIQMCYSWIVSSLFQVSFH